MGERIRGFYGTFNGKRPVFSLPRRAGEVSRSDGGGERLFANTEKIPGARFQNLQLLRRVFRPDPKKNAPGYE